MPRQLRSVPRLAEDARPGVVLLRNSTPGQVDNFRSIRAEEIACKLLTDRGITVGKVIDEQGVSGKSLANRPDARNLVDELERGVWRAVAVVEVSRASRDPDGIDQRIFRKACKRGRALMLTPSKTYDFRNRGDSLMYDVEAIVAGHEWEDIRQRSFDGNTARARMVPVVYGFPPFGYTTEPVTVIVRGTERVKRTYAKDLDQTPLMTALGKAMDEEDGLAAVAARLNAEGHLQPPNPRNTIARRWYWTQIEQVLNIPLYYGRYEYGRHKSDDSDDLWEALPEDQQQIAYDVPHLAWYTQERIEGWKGRLQGKKGTIRVRPSGWARPLLGVLLCRLCRQPMISQGARGYSCRLIPDGRCRGQSLSGPQAEGAVRRLLDRLLPDLAELTRRILPTLEADQAPDLAAELRAIQRDISTRFELAAESKRQGLDVPTDFYDKVAELQTKQAALSARLADADRLETERRRLLHAAAQFTDPEEWLDLYDVLSAGKQRAMLQRLVQWVVVETNGGRGNRAKAWVADYDVVYPLNSDKQLESWVSWLNGFDVPLATGAALGATA